MDALQVQHGLTPDEFHRVCFEHRNGATEKDLTERGWDKTSILNAANVCLSDGRVRLVKLGDKQYAYMAVDPRTLHKHRNLTQEHELVLQQVEKSGNKGVWSRQLRDQTNLESNMLTKITKDLLKRQLIKEVKVAGQSVTRKVFMLYDVEPSAEVSGGTWYQDGKFNSAWVTSLRERCLKLLEENSGNPVSLEELHHTVSAQPGPSVVTVDSIQHILRSLELDEEVFRRETASGDVLYLVPRRNNRGPFDIYGSMQPDFVTSRTDPSWVRPPAPETGPSCPVPCLACNLTEECRPGGRICPEKCEYLASWQAGPTGPTFDVDMEDIGMNLPLM